MRDFPGVCERIQGIFCEELQVEPPAVGDELIEAGLLDSMMFVSLLLHLEGEFGVNVDLQTVEISDFSSIEKIAQLVMTVNNAQAVG